MNNIFTIFFVGDLHTFSLIKEHFEREFEFDINLILIDSKQAYLQEFNTKAPDLVIVNSSETSLSDSFILSFTNTKDPLLPIILVKDKVDRNTSIILITSGASDVIARKDMNALLYASHREIIAYYSLKKRLRLKEQAFTLAKIGPWEVDLLDGIVTWSDQVREIFEVPRDFEPTIENRIDFYATDDERHYVRELHEKLEKTGGGFQYESRIITLNGTEKWIRVAGDCLRVDGETVKIFGTTQDITQIKDSESRLNEANNRLTNVIEQSDNLYYEHNINGDITYKSSQFNEFFQVSIDQDTNLNWTDFITDHPINLKGIKITDKAFRTGKSQPPYELQLKKGTGEPFWVLVNETPIIRDGETIRIAGTVTDITDIKTAQSEVEKLSLVAEHTQNLVVITDKEGNTEWVNNAFIHKTGYTLEEVKGIKPGNILQGPKTDTRTINKVSALLKEQKPFSVTILNYTKNSEKYWIKMDIAPVFDETGNVINFFSIQEDITQKRRLQKELKEIEKFYDLAVEGAEVGLWELDLNSYKAFFNSVYYEMLGYKKEEVTFSKDFHNEIFHPESHELIEDHIQKILTGQEDSFEDIFQVKAKNGDYRWILNRAKVVEYKDGKPSKLAGSHINITERIEAQKRSEEINKRLELLIEASPVAIFQTDAKGVIVDSWNKEAERVFGYNQNEVMGKRFYDLVDISKRDLNLIKRIRGGQILQQESIRILDENNHERILEVSTGPIFDQQQKLQRTLVLVTDITELHEQHQKVKESNEEKTILLQEIHHRVKNNLAIISGLLELQLMNGEDNMAIKKSIYRIKAIANVHEQLYSSNNLSEINLISYYQNLLDSLTSNLCGDRNITYSLNFDVQTLNINQAIPLGILTTELVTNSIKYAFNDHKSGNINLKISRAAEDKVCYKYSDTGVGFDFDTKLNSGSFGVLLITTILSQLTYDYKTYTDKGFNLEFTFEEHERGAHSNLNYAAQK